MAKIDKKNECHFDVVTGSLISWKRTKRKAWNRYSHSKQERLLYLVTETERMTRKYGKDHERVKALREEIPRDLDIPQLNMLGFITENT